MASVHLTDVVVSRLKTPGIYYDSTTPAFGVRVGKHRKAWIITKGTDRQRITIGQYPAMSLAGARKEAKKRLADDTPRSGRVTFEEAYDDYKTVIATKKPRTQRDYNRMLGKHLLPKLRKKQLTDIVYDDVTAVTDELSESERNHCLAVGRTFFKWCVRPPRRYIPHSPLEGVEVKQGGKRKRVLKPEEIVPVWRAAKRQSYPHGTIVQLLLLTGQRRGEIANLQRPWINEKERIITLPEWLTKNGKEHTFPYGDMTAAVLDSVPRLNTTNLLFPSRVSDDRPVSGWSKFKKQMDDEVEGWTLHDLRRTFRTIHAEIGTPSHIGERLINHVAAVQTDVEAIYDRYKYLPEMAAATAAYEAHLSALLARR
jgi:integrase